MALMSNAARAIPVTWYEDYRGKDIHYVLTIIARNNKTTSRSQQRTYQDFARPMFKGRQPSSREFMAIMIVTTIPMKANENIKEPNSRWWESIRQYEYEEVVTWNRVTAPHPPKSAPVEEWEAWFLDEYQTLHPRNPRSNLSSGACRFFDTVANILVTGVNNAKINWSLEHDINRPTDQLRQYFEGEWPPQRVTEVIESQLDGSEDDRTSQDGSGGPSGQDSVEVSACPLKHGRGDESTSLANSTSAA